MKRIVTGTLSLALVLGVVASLPAQQAGPGRPDRPRRSLLDRLTNELALTDDQIAKIKDLEAQRRERMRAAGDDREQRREVMAWFRNEVRKVLTEEQAKKFDNLFRRRRRGGRDFIARWKEQLGLTEDQVNKIRALAPLLRQRLQEAGRDPAKRREVWQWYQNEIRGILTEEQRAKYDAAVSRLRKRLATVGLIRIDWALRGLDLTEEQRSKLARLRSEREKKVRAAYEAFRNSLKDVLTAEQLKKFEENLKRMRRPPKPGIMIRRRSSRRREGKQEG